jgi:hypothetical protein
MGFSFLIACAAVLGGCQKRGVGFGLNHPALTPADASRDRLVARVIVPSFERTSATVEHLRARGALPFGAAELRTMLLARLSLPEQALELVDTGRPLALAYVVPLVPLAPLVPLSPSVPSPPAGTPALGETEPLLAGALALRAPEGAGAFVEALGTLVGNDREVSQLRRSDGESVWILRVGQALAWAASREALIEAGAHALEARTEAPDDLVVTGYPAAWARSRGVDLRHGHEPLKRHLLERLDSQDERRRPAAEQASLEALMDFVLRPMAETDAVDLRLGLGRERGVELSLRAHPHAGSAFAARTATRKPYLLESVPQVPGTPAPVGLAVMGDDPAFLELFLDVLEAQGRAGVAGAAETADRLRPLIPRLRGAFGATVRPTGAELTADLAFPLRGGVNPQALDDLATLLDNPGLSPLLRQLYRVGPIRTSRANQQLRAEIGSSLTVVASIARGHLVLATEPGAGERLAAFAGRGAGLPAETGLGSPALQAALQETRGKEGLVFVELLGLLRPVLPAVVRGPGGRMLQGLLSMPGLSDKKMPCWIGLTGGTALGIDVHLPLETLSNASGMLGLFAREG